MVNVGSVENFERAEITNFAVGTEYKTSKYAGLTFELIELGDEAKPSGFHEVETVGVGKKVLVVGEHSTVRIAFSKNVTALSWNYYLENPDNILTVTVETDGERQTFATGKLSVLTQTNLGDAVVSALEIRATSAGSLHIDDLRWQDA